MSKNKQSLIVIFFGGIVPYILILLVQRINIDSIQTQRSLDYLLLIIILVSMTYNSIFNIRSAFIDPHNRLTSLVIAIASLLFAIFVFIILGILFTTRYGIGF